MEDLPWVVLIVVFLGLKLILSAMEFAMAVSVSEGFDTLYDPVVAWWESSVDVMVNVFLRVKGEAIKVLLAGKARCWLVCAMGLC
jgi:hypothetical protein